MVWAIVQTASPRETAVDLLLTMRLYHSDCRVWLGGRALTPTVEEIKNYHLIVASTLAGEKLVKKSAKADVAEVQPVPCAELSNELLLDPADLDLDI